MKSMQVLFVCAFVVICSANPIPDEPVIPASAPVAEVAQLQSTSATISADVPAPVPDAKSADVPAPVPDTKSAEVPAINVPITETSSAKSEEKIPEPQALPSKSEESPSAKPEEKKREIQEPVAETAAAAAAATAAEPTVKSAEQAKSVQPTEIVKSEQPTAQNVETVAPKALDSVSKASEQLPQVEQKPAESVKSLAPETTQQELVQVVPAIEAKQAAVSAVESTVVPAGISSEKKIDAEAPAPIVSENVQVPVESELKSVPAVPAAPAVAALSVEPVANPSLESTSSSSSSSSNNNNEKKASNESEQDSSSEDSSEESKESDDKKSA